MTPASGVRPRPSKLQRHWLVELGVDRYFIDHLCSDDTFASEVIQATGTKPAKQGVPESAPGHGTTAKPAGMPDPVAQLRRSATPSGQVVAHAGATVSLEHALVPADSLAGLQQQVASCNRCDLHLARATTVFGLGVSDKPDFMLVGEAPTTDDDRVGQPFQGLAGSLLHAMLQAAGIDAGSQVYLSQLVKCRPLGNRPPSKEEIQCCAAYLRRQIALVQPGRLVALGQLAAQALTGQSLPLHELHGKAFQYQCESGRSIEVLVTHNPTALLSRPQHKLQVWRDLLHLRA